MVVIYQMCSNMVAINGNGIEEGRAGGGEANRKLQGKAGLQANKGL